MPKAKSSTGATASGATGTPCVPAAPSRLRCSPQLPRPTYVDPPQMGGGGSDRNSIPLYDFPSWHIEAHRLTVMPIRTSALRTLGAQGNVFAIESFLDELASERGEDPVAFRLRHMKDTRAQDVIRAAARRANWKPAPR